MEADRRNTPKKAESKHCFRESTASLLLGFVGAADARSTGHDRLVGASGYHHVTWCINLRICPSDGHDCHISDKVGVLTNR